MASRDLVTRPAGRVASQAAEGSAFEKFLDHTVVHERAGAVMPVELVRFGLYAACVIAVTGILGLISPSSTAMRQGDFFLVLGPLAADLRDLLHLVGMPLFVGGLVMLLVDLILEVEGQSPAWRYLIVAQFIAGGFSGLVGGVFLLVLVFNLALWITLYTLLIVGLFLLLAGLIQGE